MLEQRQSLTLWSYAIVLFLRTTFNFYFFNGCPRSRTVLNTLFALQRILNVEHRNIPPIVHVLYWSRGFCLKNTLLCQGLKGLRIAFGNQPLLIAGISSILLSLECSDFIWMHLVWCNNSEGTYAGTKSKWHGGKWGLSSRTLQCFRRIQLVSFSGFTFCKPVVSRFWFAPTFRARDLTFVPTASPANTRRIL